MTDMVEVPRELLETLRLTVRVVDEQQIAEGELHTEQQVVELDRVYEAAAAVVDPLEREGFFDDE